MSNINIARLQAGLHEKVAEKFIVTVLDNRITLSTYTPKTTRTKQTFIGNIRSSGGEGDRGMSRW